ncbi:hypothetical protein V8G54_016826, partial [Vigna mungo]
GATVVRRWRDSGATVVRRGLLLLDLPHPITVPGCVPFHGLIKAFKDEERGYPPLYPVRPFVQIGNWDNYSWLYKRVGVSDMVGEATRWFGFVCLFWSGGTLSQEQMNELTHGLELSKHKFLWFVKASSDEANAGYLGGEKDVGCVCA